MIPDLRPLWRFMEQAVVALDKIANAKDREATALERIADNVEEAKEAEVGSASGGQ